MIGYTMVGTENLERAKAFYTPIFSEMSLSPCYEDAQVASWGHAKDASQPRFLVCYPYDGNPASVGNGTMTAFQVNSATRVGHLYDLALANGGRDAGPPGFRREQYGDKFYVAYVRDPDGNKLAFACYDGKGNP